MIETLEALDVEQMTAVIRVFELRESSLALAKTDLDALGRAKKLSARQLKAVRQLLTLSDEEVDRALFKSCADGDTIELLLEHRTYVAHLHNYASVED